MFLRVGAYTSVNLSKVLYLQAEKYGSKWRVWFVSDKGERFHYIEFDEEYEAMEFLQSVEIFTEPMNLMQWYYLLNPDEEYKLVRSNLFNRRVK